MIADRLRLIQAVSGGGGGGGFDPSQLSGLKLWLKADTGVTVDGSGNVSSWADQSGNSNTAYQTDPTKYPVLSAAYAVNGVPAVVAQNDQFLQLTQNFSGRNSTTPFTFIWVGTKTNSTTGTTVLEALTGGGGIRYMSSATVFQALLPNVAYVGTGEGKGLLNPNAHYSRMDYPNYRAEVTQGTSVVQNVNYDGVVNFARLFIGPTYNLTNPGYALNEVMLLDRSISDAELADIKAYIKARYNLYTSDSLILNMQGTAGTAVFTDESPNALSVTPYGNATLVSDATFGTVASFDGTGDYLDTPNTTTLDLPGDFTIESWVYGIGLSTTSSCIIGKWQNPIAWALLIATDKVQLGTGNNGSFSATHTFSTTITNGAWNHVAISRSGTSIKCFLNGSQIGSTITSSVNLSATSTTDIGRLKSTNSNYLTGLIGPTRITKGAARYTANFTPPTGLFPTS